MSTQPIRATVLRALAAICLLALPPVSQAAECNTAEVQRLQKLVRTSYNAYQFSRPDEINRCMPLFAAVSHQQRLPILLSECNSKAAAMARMELDRLEGMLQDRANCN
jgi:hypothetical protein